MLFKGDFLRRIAFGGEFPAVIPVGNFAGEDDEIGRGERFASDAGFGILREQGVQNGIGDLVADFVRMAFGNGFRCKDVTRLDS